MQQPQCNLLVPTRTMISTPVRLTKATGRSKIIFLSMDTGKNIKEVDDDGALDRLEGVTFMELLGGEADRLIDVKGEEEQREKKKMRLQCSFIFSSFSSGQMICFNASEEDSVLNGSLDKLSESTLSVTSSATKQEILSGSTSSTRASTLRKKPKSSETSHPLPCSRSIKLRGRIAALRQLISATERFAVKPDTASVLRHVMEHIKLLLQKVEILSSPHLEHQQVPLHDLRSRGLCLMPASSLEKVTSNSHAYAFSLNEGLGQRISDCSSKH